MLYRSVLCSFIARTAVREENKGTRGILIKTMSQRVVRTKFKTLLQMLSSCYFSFQNITKAIVKIMGQRSAVYSRIETLHFKNVTKLLLLFSKIHVYLPSVIKMRNVFYRNICFSEYGCSGKKILKLNSGFFTRFIIVYN